MTIGVQADVRRIAQALTLPEYLEAWLCLPGRGGEPCLVASQNRNGFRLDGYSDGGAAVRIITSYCFRHQRKIRLLWRRICELNYSESIVDFRVRGNFGASVLELHHIGFDSAGEYLWSQELWRASFAKLTSLLLPIP